jgi:hypothetical protein
MEQPEEVTGNCVVVARPPHVEEAEDVLVEEVEPEEAVILAWFALHREVEVRWIAEGGKHMPRRGDQQQDQRAGEGAELTPLAPAPREGEP